MGQSFSVTGLNCQSCVKHVTEAITGIDGVLSVTVDLEPKGMSTLLVESSRSLSDDEVAAALAEEGNYSLVR